MRKRDGRASGAGSGGKSSGGYKVPAALSAVVAGLVARKLITVVWRLVTGHPPPAKPEHPDVAWGEALSWAVVSGTAIGVARLVAQRQVAATWQHANPEAVGGSAD